MTERVKTIEAKWKEAGEGLPLPAGVRLSYRHRAFIASYITHFDPKKAAMAVGYKDPVSMGNKLVSGEVSPQVARALQRLADREELNAIIESDELLERLTRVVRCDPTQVYGKNWVVVDDPKDIPQELREMMTKIKVERVKTKEADGSETNRFRVEFEYIGKAKAIDLLMKAKGMFAPQEHKHTVGMSWDQLFAQAQPDNDIELIDGAIAKAVEG